MLRIHPAGYLHVELFRKGGCGGGANHRQAQSPHYFIHITRWPHQLGFALIIRLPVYVGQKYNNNLMFKIYFSKLNQKKNKTEISGAEIAYQ